MQPEAPKYNLEAAIAAGKALAATNGKTEAWAESVLSIDPFDGDFGDVDSRTLADHLAIAQRAGKCRGIEGPCERGVLKGDLCRVIKMADSEGFYGGRVCVECLDREFRRDLEDEEDDGEDVEGVDPWGPTL